MPTCVVQAVFILCLQSQNILFKMCNISLTALLKIRQLWVMSAVSNCIQRGPYNCSSFHTTRVGRHIFLRKDCTKIRTRRQIPDYSITLVYINSQSHRGCCIPPSNTALGLSVLTKMSSEPTVAGLSTLTARLK